MKFDPLSSYFISNIAQAKLLFGLTSCDNSADIKEAQMSVLFRNDVNDIIHSSKDRKTWLVAGLLTYLLYRKGLSVVGTQKLYP